MKFNLKHIKKIKKALKTITGWDSIQAVKTAKQAANFVFIFTLIFSLYAAATKSVNVITTELNYNIIFALDMIVCIILLMYYSIDTIVKRKKLKIKMVYPIVVYFIGHLSLTAIFFHFLNQLTNLSANETVLYEILMKWFFVQFAVCFLEMLMKAINLHLSEFKKEQIRESSNSKFETGKIYIFSNKDTSDSEPSINNKLGRGKPLRAIQENEDTVLTEDYEGKRFWLSKACLSKEAIKKYPNKFFILKSTLNYFTNKKHEFIHALNCYLWIFIFCASAVYIIINRQSNFKEIFVIAFTIISLITIYILNFKLSDKAFLNSNKQYRKELKIMMNCAVFELKTSDGDIDIICSSDGQIPCDKIESNKSYEITEII